MVPEDVAEEWFDEYGDTSGDESSDNLSCSQLSCASSNDSDSDGTVSEEECVISMYMRRRETRLKSTFAKLEKVKLSKFNADAHYDALLSAQNEVDLSDGTVFFDVLEFYPKLISLGISLANFMLQNKEVASLADGHHFFFLYESFGLSIRRAAEDSEVKITKTASKKLEKLKKFHNRMLRALESLFGSMDVCYGSWFTPFSNARADRHEVQVVASNDASGTSQKTQIQLCNVVSEASPRLGERVVSVGKAETQSAQTNVVLKRV